jgi:uncharacterized C2H2 Zn-finger protein
VVRVRMSNGRTVDGEVFLQVRRTAAIGQNLFQYTHSPSLCIRCVGLGRKGCPCGLRRLGRFLVILLGLSFWVDGEVFLQVRRTAAIGQNLFQYTHSPNNSNSNPQWAGSKGLPMWFTSTWTFPSDFVRVVFLGYVLMV